jgi:hypothetical protein
LRGRSPHLPRGHDRRPRCLAGFGLHPAAEGDEIRPPPARESTHQAMTAAPLSPQCGPGGIRSAVQQWGSWLACGGKRRLSSSITREVDSLPRVSVQRKPRRRIRRMEWRFLVAGLVIFATHLQAIPLLAFKRFHQRCHPATILSPKASWRPFLTGILAGSQEECPFLAHLQSPNSHCLTMMRG